MLQLKKIHYLEQADYHVEKKKNCHKAFELKSFL